MKKRIVLSLVAIALFVIDSNAQTQKIDESAWMTIASEKAEFSLRMPKSSLVHVDGTAQLPLTSLIGFDESVSIRYSRTKEPGAKKTWRNWGSPANKDALVAEQRIDDVELRMIVTNDGKYRLSIYAASDSNFYYLSIVGKSKEDPAIAYVLNSIRIKGRPLVISKDSAAQNDGAPVELSSLKTSQEIIDVLKAKRPKWNGKITYKPLAAYTKTETDMSVREPVDLTALKPKFNFSPMLKGGLIRLRVVYKADGRSAI
ncbi:MAG: hypothetical protein IPJ30_06475 [Acidobacteria bacterium]|nr:hypothetical protein [Acidobacteriota bacterium]